MIHLKCTNKIQENGRNVQIEECKSTKQESIRIVAEHHRELVKRMGGICEGIRQDTKAP